MHDQIGQNLTAIGLNLNIIRALLPAHMEHALARINDSITLLEQTTRRTRDIMARLRPPVLDDYGLIAALEWHSKKFSTRTGIGVDICGDESLPRLTPEKEISLFRIAQEALTNVLKHAQATEVTITIESKDGNVRMLIRDNGIGFDHSELHWTEGSGNWGILNMTERARRSGGICSIESSVGHGTSVIVELPK